MQSTKKTISKTYDFMISQSRTLLILGIAIIFVVMAVYIYRSYVLSSLGSYLEGYSSRTTEPKEPKEPKEITGNEKHATMYMFKTDWCPHCKTALPIWTDFINKNSNLKINNSVINFKTIDCEKEKEKCDTFKIKGYPTFKLEKSSGEVIEFDGSPKEALFMEFLKSELS